MLQNYWGAFQLGGNTVNLESNGTKKKALQRE